ncbi:Asp-tRNA(Asn)/Glu-tRNA(Gln) amidotransferase subunit GatC [Ekhidna sp. To15]|uniref:Asp-tRNA(Asn)/Glu-tRNA(Gln) amidotransferase subunit GatC n=1 Tax=Ekhidna sp. To15 TaxID=3395267 RepID=UPI003F51E70D
MKITKEIVQKTAHLARLKFDENEEARMIGDLQKMVDWVDKLKEVDTESTLPLTGMSSEINAFREDVNGRHLPREKALKNAPKHDSEYFRVPKVIN